MDCCKPKSISVEASKPESEEQKLIDNGDITTKEELSKTDSEVGSEGSDLDDGETVSLEDIDDGYSDVEERDRDLSKCNKQFKDSGGFHVDYFPKFRLLGMRVPVGDTRRVRRLTLLAIKSYNEKTGGKYKFERVLRATGSPCQGMVFYITYLAKEGDEEGENIDDEIKKYESSSDDEFDVVYRDDDGTDGTYKIGDITGDLVAGAKIFEAKVYWEIPSCNAEVDYCELKEVQAIEDS